MKRLKVFKTYPDLIKVDSLVHCTYIIGNFKKKFEFELHPLTYLLGDTLWAMSYGMYFFYQI